MENANLNITAINWESDNTNIVRAKQELDKFIQEQNEFKGKSTPKIDNYHQRRIQELKNYILNN